MIKTGDKTDKDDKNIFLFTKTGEGENASLQLAYSTDGFNFKASSKNPSIVDTKNGKEETLDKCEDFRVVKLNGDYLLTYKRFTSKSKFSIIGAVSEDLINWRKVGSLSKIGESGMVVPNYSFKDNYVFYFGEGDIKVAFSKSLKRWRISENPVLEPRRSSFDNDVLEVINCRATEQGIFVIYAVKDKKGVYSAIGAAIFDKNDPTRLLSRTDRPLWKRDEKWVNKSITPIGVIHFDGQTITYWSVEGVGVRAIVLPPILRAKVVMQKFEDNPIIAPRPGHDWEALGTFNAAAVEEGGKVHLVYRSVTNGNTSVLGYAKSGNGTHIEERSSEPVFVHLEKDRADFVRRKRKTSGAYFSPIAGWCGGCEDPRLTKIDDKIYMTFVSYDGANPPRVALTSIAVKDFLNKNWKWEKPVLISPPGVINKNAVIFPERINGKYIILHRIFPSILIDFVDDLNFDGTRFLKGEYSIGPRVGYWDSRKVGAGAPPIRTSDGWLLIYHAVGDKDPMYRYCIGAMLLDSNDPTKVLHRTDEPIIMPEGGDGTITYPCGAVVKDGRLFVYYGSNDYTLKVASADLDQFLRQVKGPGPAKIFPVTGLGALAGMSS